MRVAVIGGTGRMGGAIGRKLSSKHEIIIGSREVSKAKRAAFGIKGAVGSDYAGAASECSVAIFTIPFSSLDHTFRLAEALTEKLIVSAINPLKFDGGVFRYGLDNGSAAEMVANKFPKSKVATAFNNVPVSMLEMTVVPAMDILVAATSRDAYDETAEIIRSVEQLRPLYAGQISEAHVVERVTPLVLNLARWNKTGSLTTRFVSGD